MKKIGEIREGERFFIVSEYCFENGECIDCVYEYEKGTEDCLQVYTKNGQFDPGDTAPISNFTEAELEYVFENLNEAISHI